MKLIRFGLLLLVAVRVVMLWPRFRRFLGASSIAVRDEQVRYRVTREPRSGRRSALAIGIGAPVGLRFAIRPETQWDHTGKFLGLSREWQSGDPAFDDAVYVVADDPPLIELLSRDSTLRREVAALVTRPDGELYSAGDWLWLEREWPGPGASEQSDEAAAREFAGQELAALQRVRDLLGPAVQLARRDGGGLPLLLVDWLVAACVVVGVVGGLCFLWEGGLGTPRQLVDDIIEQRAGMAFAGVTAIVTLLLFALLRRASFTHLVVLELLLVGLPGAWLISHAAHQWLNQALDVSAPELVLVEVKDAWVTETRSRRGGKRRSYNVRMAGWPDLRVPETLQVQSAAYEQFRQASCVEVTWRRGYFGDPWASAWRPTDDCAAFATLSAERMRSQVKALIGRARRSSQPKDWMRVRKVAERAAALQPADGWLQRAAGQAAFVARDYPSAAAHLQEAAKLTPDDVEVWIGLGHSQMRMRRFHEAIESFQRALELRPGHMQTLADRSVARLNDGDRAGALQDAKLACENGARLGCALVDELEGRLGDNAR